MYLLIPGRHQLLTKFQFQYLQNIINNGLKSFTDAFGNPIDKTGKIEAVPFAVTSSNHSNTRRNPLPFYLQAPFPSKRSETNWEFLLLSMASMMRAIFPILQTIPSNVSNTKVKD